MTTTRVTRHITAPVARVFDVVAHIENFKQAIPHITEVVSLSETTRGVGTKFRETRIMKGRAATTELEVTEYVDNDRIRLVSDTGGSIWDTVFTVATEADGTRLVMVMEARPHKFMARIFNPLIKGMVRRAVESDMDAVKAYCEQPEA